MRNLGPAPDSLITDSLITDSLNPLTVSRRWTILWPVRGGPVAQSGERDISIVEARGSNPLGSTSLHFACVCAKIAGNCEEQEQ